MTPPPVTGSPCGPRFSHALVIGKFYPPHRGHHRLIREAARRAENVSVVVMASAREGIALADRVAWVRDEHADDPSVAVVGIACDAPLDTGDEQVWAAQVACIRAAVDHLAPARSPIDVVVSGEAYGAELAARLGAAAVRIGRDGVSATAVRADLAGGWEELAPATRAGLAVRAVVVGAESTGTTTVSRRLADRYRARGGVWARTGWVAEYGRRFTEIKWDAAVRDARAAGRVAPALDEITWTAGDFDEVAAEQTRREEAAARAGSPLLVCDTDALATWIWKRRYLGERAAADRPAWARPPALPRHDVYLVTDHRGVPWHDDGMREGDLAVREAMTGWFVEALTVAGYSWVLLTGTLEQRVSLAERTLDALLESRLALPEPLHGPGFEAAAPSA